MLLAVSAFTAVENLRSKVQTTCFITLFFYLLHTLHLFCGLSYDQQIDMHKFWYNISLDTFIAVINVDKTWLKWLKRRPTYYAYSFPNVVFILRCRFVIQNEIYLHIKNKVLVETKIDYLFKTSGFKPNLKPKQNTHVSSWHQLIDVLPSHFVSIIGANVR